jgi:predicted DNA binding CopG/RHH family protein
MARSKTVRFHADLFLSPEEQRQLEAEAAADLRTPSNLVTQAVLAALGRKRPVKLRASLAKRTRYSVKLRLSAQQLRELKRRAEAEGRLVANYVNAVVVSRLGKG